MEEGEFKYTEYGQQVVVIEKVSNTVHRVQFVYERDEDDEPRFGDTRLWDRQLFDSPPMPRLHDLAAKMEQQIAKMEADKKTLAVEVQQYRDAKAALEKEFNQIPGLQNIVDFLKTPPTHFILKKYHYPYMVSVDRCKVDYSILAQIGIKTEWGMKAPQVQWWIKTKKADNDYAYNDSENGIPCNGIDDAKAKLKVALLEWYTENKNYNHTVATIQMLRDNGIEVPDSRIANVIAGLNAELHKIGADVASQKAKKRGEIDEWQSLLKSSSIPATEA